MRVKNRWFALILVTLIILISTMLLVRINSWNCRTPILQEITRDKPMVALTFDDGPNSKYTPKVLEILSEKNALATFFICGNNINRNEALIKEIIFMGHEIENHTDTHQNLSLLSRDKIIEEVTMPQKRINAILPDYKYKFLRPPFGEYEENVEEAVEVPLILWDVDSDDYKEKDVNVIKNNVLSNVKDGSIVVFHDDNKNTVKALSEIIDELQSRGFQLVTVSQIIEYKK